MTETTGQPTETSPDIPTVVQTWELSKSYQTGFWMNQVVESLKSVTLTVYQGETFGLLGPNGAGKTTLLKILLGMVRRSGGRATLLGKPLGDRKIKEKIGYLPENPYFYDYLTAWEFLAFTAGVFQIPAKEHKQRIQDLLDWVGLDTQTAQKKQMRTYSKGMLQRVGMAQALINNPDVVFLDEPMSGLDPTGRYRIREIIQTLKKAGKTIFFNSHILADVEEICDRIAILAKGEILCMGTIDKLLGTDPTYAVSGTGGTADTLKEWVDPLNFTPNGWHGSLITPPQTFLNALPTLDIQLTRLNPEKPSLESFFMEKINNG